MSDTLEAKAAVLAVKENTSLPIFCTMTFDESYKTLTGGDVKVMSAIMEGLGVDCVGINCGLGPAQIGEMMTDLAEISSIPIMHSQTQVCRKSKTAKQFTMYYRNNLQTNVNIWQSLVRLFSAVVAVQHLTI